MASMTGQQIQLLVDRSLQTIQHCAIARAISKSNHLTIAALQIVHICGFLLVLTSLALMCLRLLGLVLQQQRVRSVTRDTTRLLWGGLALAIVSGSLLFLTGPTHYFYNRAFEAKMLLLAAAVAVQLSLFRRVVARDAPRPRLARWTAALSLALWFAVAVAGRAIAFV